MMTARYEHAFWGVLDPLRGDRNDHPVQLIDDLGDLIALVGRASLGRDVEVLAVVNHDRARARPIGESPEALTHVADRVGLWIICDALDVMGTVNDASAV